MADYVVRMTGQDNLSGTIKQVKSELNDLGKTTSKLDQIDKKFNKITQSAVGVKKEMRDLTALGSQLKFDGDYNAAQLLKIAKAAGEAKDSMDDFNAMKKYFADDNRHLNTAIQGMQGLAAAGSVTAGVLGMVGVEQEKVNQAILWCQSALSVLNGLNTIANVLNKDSYVSIAMKVAGLKAEAAATDKATASQTRLNLAVLANPYVMLAMVVAAAAVAIYGFAKSNDEATRAQEDLNKSSENYKKNQESQNQTVAESIVKFKDLQSQWNDLGNDLNAKKKFVNDNKTAFKDLGLKVDGVTSAESVFGKNANAVIAAMRARARAAAAYATMVDNLKDQYAKLAQIEQKLKNGEQFSQSDLADIGILNPDAMAGLREDFTWSAFFGGQKYYTVIGKTAATQIMDAATATVERRADELNKPLEEAMKRAREEAANVPFYSPGSSSSGSGSSGSGSKGGSGSGSSGSGSSGSEEIKAEVNSLNDLKKQRQELLNIIGNQNLSEADLITKIQNIANLDLQIKQREKEINDELEKRKKLIQDAIKAQRKGIDKVSDSAATPALSDMGSRYTDKNKVWTAPTVDAASRQRALERLQRLNELLRKQEDERIKQLAIQQEKYNGIVESVQNIGQAFSSLGNMTDDVGLKAAGIIAQTIAQLALSYAYAVSDAGKKLGWVGWLVAGTSGLATLTAMIAQIHSLSGYASGGIISGGSSYGDHILARVNAGEMVLNRKQQSNLFRAIESGNIGAGQTVLVPEFKIKGSDLYGTLRNFSKSVGKTGKVTGIR
jgi:uncharacterized protein YoxC